jgi:hypothetical protein
VDNVNAIGIQFARAWGWRTIRKHKVYMPHPFQVVTFSSKPGELPLREQIGLRGRIATFESQFGDGFDKNAEADIEFLSSLSLGKCAYGASDCQIYPFIYAPTTPHHSLPQCSTILTHLGVKAFKGQSSLNLDSENIHLEERYRGTQSDEIHTDPEDQFIFSTVGENLDSMATHNKLRERVLNKHLYYVLLHTMPRQFDKYWFSDWVILFALGVSTQTGSLIGVVTHQACHNLCD